MASQDKTGRLRQQVAKATSTLLYRKGFNAMSFTDIAEAAEVPRGNLYYHFRTKDDVLEAVIEHRLDKTRAMLKGWEEEYPAPLDRLLRFARIMSVEKDDVVRYGCPMGSLNSELGKQQSQLQGIARQQFDLFVDWLAAQFAALGQEPARELAVRLLIRTQGVALVSQAYGDPELIVREVREIENWVRSLTPG